MIDRQDSGLARQQPTNATADELRPPCACQYSKHSPEDSNAAVPRPARSSFSARRHPTNQRIQADMELSNYGDATREHIVSYCVVPLIRYSHNAIPAQMISISA